MAVGMAGVIEKDFVAEHSQEFFQKHAGKYIAVVDDELVAVGSSLEVFKKAKNETFCTFSNSR